MPIYEFECAADGRWDGLFSIKDEEQVKPCPTCGAESKRVPSLSSFELKGDGWFKTLPIDKDKKS